MILDREIMRTLTLASMCWIGMCNIARADFAITSWSLGPGVFDFSIPQGNQAFHGSPQPAFNQTLIAAYSNSLAEATYQYNWTPTAGQFNNGAHIEAQGGPDFLASIDNLVRITPTTDVLLTVNAQWTFQLGGGDRSSFLVVRVGQTGSPLLMNWNYQSSPIFGGPPATTWTVHDSVLLPAGGAYFFRSVFQLDAFSGSPTVLSTGTGFANFSITTVPCPATLAPMTFAGILIRRRRTV